MELEQTAISRRTRGSRRDKPERYPKIKNPFKRDHELSEYFNFEYFKEVKI